MADLIISSKKLITLHFRQGRESRPEFSGRMERSFRSPHLGDDVRILTMKFFKWLVLACLLFAVVAEASDKRILLIAGSPSHGPGDHEFRAGVLLWEQSLKNVPGITVEVYTNGWPESDSVFEGADAVVIYADGGGKHPAVQGGRVKLIDALVKKGVGVGFAHYAVEVEKGDPQAAMWRWIGGAYEHEYSVNPMWQPHYDAFPKHPVTAGVKPFSLIDEWYFNMRWDPDAKGVTIILTDTPSDDVRDGPYVWPSGPYPHIVAATGRSETMMWTIERPDGGRGFGFTGGHKHVNWYDDNQRKVVLNAILWIAKADIPKGGVESEVTIEQIAENLDPKKGDDKIAQIAGNWDFEVNIDGNTGAPKFEFVQAGINLLGNYNGLLGQRPLKGQVSGQNVNFVINAEWEGNPISVRYEGKVREDGSMSGKFFAGANNEMEADWTANRAN